MKIIHSIAITLIVVFIIIRSGSCLRCYNCTPSEFEPCGHSFTATSAHHIVSCNSSCLTARTSSLSMSSLVLTSRSCGDLDPCPEVSNCSTCQFDFCNGPPCTGVVCYENAGVIFFATLGVVLALSVVLLVLLFLCVRRNCP